jgi:hypothetical protein
MPLPPLRGGLLLFGLELARQPVRRSRSRATFRSLPGTSGNLLWKWGAEKIPAGEAINAKRSGHSGRFSNEDSGDFIKLQPA